MLRKRVRPKENIQDIKKINPPNISFSSAALTNATQPIEVIYKCDNPKCNSKAEVFINLKYCPLCAKDKGF